MSLETSLLKHLRDWKYEGSSTTYQYSNAYEYIKDIREGVVSADLEFVDRFLGDLCNCNHLNRYRNIEKIGKLLGVDEYTYQICHDCEEVEYEEDMKTCYEDYLVCQSCCEDHYTYSEYRDTYISYDDAEEEEESNREDYEDDYIYQYDYDYKLR